jgi:hypothetical protein
MVFAEPLQIVHGELFKSFDTPLNDEPARTIGNREWEPCLVAVDMRRNGDGTKLVR